VTGVPRELKQQLEFLDRQVYRPIGDSHFAPAHINHQVTGDN
jgi:hypothetical protein